MPTEQQKADALRELAKRDATDPELQRVAWALWTASLGHRVRFCHLAHALARDGIRYQIDTERTGGEDIAGYTRPYAHPLEALRRGVDDCDAKARLFVALCEVVGVPADVVPMYRGTRLAHVAAVCQPAREKLFVETTLARARLGDPPNAVPKERDGKWKKT